MNKENKMKMENGELKMENGNNSQLSIFNSQLNNVEWKTLGEVCDLQNGFAFKSNLFKENGLPIIRITNIDGRNVSLSDVKYFSADDYNSGNPLNYSVEKGDILIAMSGATTGKIGYYNLDETAYLNQRVGKFIPNTEVLNNRFLYHFLLTKSDFLYVLAGGGAQPNLSSNSIKEKLLIPIPPLKIQQEIVAILDKFTELTTELTAELTTELTTRKKQYAFYREQLLAFEDTKLQPSERIATVGANCNSPCTVWKTLGEVAIYSKERVNFSFVNEDNYVGVENLLQDRAGKSKSNYVPISGNLTCFNIGDILIGNIRPYLKKIWFADCKGGTNGDVLVIHLIDKGVDARYLYQILADDSFFSYNMQHAKGAKMPRGNKEKIMEFKIPIPPLSEQERIVEILDKFDALTNSISEGLPREIELRQKQYEYYRNRLLDFNKWKVEN